MKKYTLDQIKGRLSNNKTIFLIKEEKKENLTIKTYIEFGRSNDNKGAKNRVKKFWLRIDSCDARYIPGDCIMEKEMGLFFHNVEEIIDYLVKKKYIQYSELIIDEK